MKPMFPERDPEDRSHYAYRQLIGILGLLMVPMLFLISAWRPTTGLSKWGLLGSVSSYYHTGSVVVFVGVLSALAAFLCTYQGYDNEHWLGDRVAGMIAGIAAIIVAFFPTAPPIGVPTPPWWTRQMMWVHNAAAAVLFASFIYFSLVLFTKSKPLAPGGTLPRDKRRRNRIYVSCGIAMVLCVLWAGGAALTGGSIFWPETLALAAFAVSWLAKGRALWTAHAAGSRTLHYARHPGQLAADVRATMQARRPAAKIPSAADPGAQPGAK